MHFSACPTRKPLAIQLPNGKELPGIKLIICDEQVFQTIDKTFVLYPDTTSLIQVCPFFPVNTLPADGWYVTQFELYPVAGE